MENLLINYLLKNCVTLAKELFSLELESVGPQEGDNALNFPNLLDVKMGRGIEASKLNVVDGAEPKENQDESAVENSHKEDNQKESSVIYFDTQSVISLMQIYFKAQDLQDNTMNTFQNDTKSIAIENFLQNIFSLLQEGESVQFVKDKAIGTICLVQKPEEEEKTVETDQYPVIEPGKLIESRPFIGYLAFVLQQFNAFEKTDKTDKKVENEEADNKDVINKDAMVTGNINQYEKYQNKEIIQMFRKTDENKEVVRADVKMAKPLLNKIETPVGFENENNEVLNLTDAIAKLSPKIEVKKLNDRENIFQIISSELSSNESDGMNKIISVLTVKAEKAVSSGDDDAAKVVVRVSDKTAGDYADPDERQLLSQNDYTKTGNHLDKEAGKVLGKAPFASIMTDRIEKIVEQYASKSVSMDMVVRLKIDEKETILVGLKEQGQRVTVEVKTTNAGMGTFLQSQKEEIARQLEGKNIYANIYVDVQNENREKREQKNHQKKRSDGQEYEEFVGFLEAMV